MITAVHALLYSRDADAVRVFLRDKLQLPSVDAGDGWLIFGLPPAELAVHPTHTDHGPELYFMCDNIAATLRDMEAAGGRIVKPATDQGWGILAEVRIPGAVTLCIYEPRHAIAAGMQGKAARGRGARRAPRKAGKKAAARTTRRRR